MSDQNRYTMLVCSLPHHGPLFGATRPPLSRIRLNRHLALLEPRDKTDYDTVSRLLDWSHQGRRRSDAELVRDAHRSIPELANPLAQEVVEWRLDVRTLLAALRRRRRGEKSPPAGEAWGYGRWVPTITRRWGEPNFGLDRVFPWVGQARTLLEADATVEMERLVMTAVWNELERRSEGHEFDFEAVLIYALRWDLVARWTRYHAEGASARFGYLVREGLAGVELNALAA